MRNETIEDVLERRKEIEQSIKRVQPELEEKYSKEELDFYKAFLAMDRPCPYRDNEKDFCNIYEHECDTPKLKFAFFVYWCETKQKSNLELTDDAKKKGLE